MELQKVEGLDWGSLSYSEAWDRQQCLHDEIKDAKIFNRRCKDKDQIMVLPSHKLVFCEHNPVFTLGKSGKAEHLLSNPELLAKEGFDFYKINRGGDITYHGPGQVVCYPIFDLDQFYTDVHKYVRMLEQIVIDTISEYDIVGQRLKEFTGVWVKDSNDDTLKKICAIGVHLSRWVTMHGFALNVNTNLDHFKYIVPCGISSEDKGICSMSSLIGRDVDINAVKATIRAKFEAHFKIKLI